MITITKEQLIEDLKASTQNTSGMFEISEGAICALMSMLTNAAPQLPQPVVLSVPDEIPKLRDGMGFKYVKDGVHYSVNYANGWNQCRAAMLHGAEPVSNRDELPLDYLQGQKDGLEWAAQLAEANHPHTGDWLYDDPIELAKAIRKGPDMPEADGNSLVIPDGWKLVPVELTGAMTNAMTDAILDDLHNVDVWRSVLAAAPQQEVKNG